MLLSLGIYLPDVTSLQTWQVSGRKARGQGGLAAKDLERLKSSLLDWLLNWVQVIEGVEPLAHEHAFSHLHLDLLLAKRLKEHETNGGVECSSIQPAVHKSGAHERGEVSLLDVEHVGGSVDGAGEVSGLNDALRVVQSVDDGLVNLPVVVIHLSCFFPIFIITPFAQWP